MSFILDALKKAEQEKNTAQPQPLAAAVTAPVRSYQREQPSAQRRQQMIVGGGILLVLLVGLGLWLLHGRTRPANLATTASAAAPVPVTVPNPVQPPAPQPVPVPAPPATTAPETGAAKEEMAAAEAGTEPVLPGEAGAPATNLDDLVGEEEAAAAPVPEAEPSADQIATLSKPVAPASKKSRQASPPSPASKPSAESESGVKPLRDMPPSFRSSFPQLSIDVHYFDENPLRRFVIVNGRKYRETDTLVEGPKVIEITPTGVVLEQGGTRVVKSIQR